MSKFPVAPTQVKATPGNTEVFLSWSANPANPEFSIGK